jgi:zinc protease
MTQAGKLIELPPLSARVVTLGNGVQVVLDADRSAPVASVQAWVRTGSIHEGRFLGAGISHLLEHLLFKGTEKRPASGFARGIQDLGGYLNGYTSFDRTVYWADLPAAGVLEGLELLADAVFQSVLPAEEYGKEQEVIRREFAMGADDPDRVAGRNLFATAYRVHPFRHPVIGHLELFNALSREDVLGYYRARYAPANVFFVVVGDVDADAVVAHLGKWAGGVDGRPIEPVFVPQEPPQLGSRELHAEFGTELTRLHMAWHVPGVGHPESAALDLLAGVLGNGRSSRLYRRVREERRLAHRVGAWNYAPGDSGLFGIHAVLEPGQTGELVGELRAMVRQVAEHGVAAAELEKARKQALAGQFRQLTTMRGKASDLASNWHLAGDLDFSRNYLQQLKAVECEAVRRVAERYLVEDNLTLTSLAPKGQAIRCRVSGAAEIPGPIQKTVLTNGMRVLVREDARLPLVSLVATFRAGALAEKAEESGITQLLARTLLKGTHRHSAAELAERLESVGGHFGAEAGNNTISVSVEVLEEDLELGFRILGEVLRDATLPEDALEREREVQRAAIKSQEEDIQSVARHLLFSGLLGRHPYGRRILGTQETLSSLSRTDLVRFRDRHLVGANGVLAVFGKVDARQVSLLAERELGGAAGFPEGHLQFESVLQPEPLATKLELQREMEREQAVLMVGYLGADLASPDRVALDLIDEACSDLGSRFFVRIREELGLAYSVGTSHGGGLARGGFVFHLGTDPAKLTAVRAEFLDEIRQLAEGGLTPEELERAKRKMLGAMDMAQQSNAGFAFSCAVDELYGLGFDRHQFRREAVREMTLETVREVARRYFAQQPHVVAVVRPAAVHSAVES